MPIVIKEIQVNTVVEKKVLLLDEISEKVYVRLKERIVEEFPQLEVHSRNGRSRKER